MYIIDYYVEAIEDIRFNTFPGFLLRGAFFAMLKEIEPKLAIQIHESKRIAPYSIKIFENLKTGKILFNFLKSNELTRFSFNLLNEELFENYRDKFIRDKFIISDKLLVVRKININRMSFKDVSNSIQTLPTNFTIDFLTPTAFRLPVITCCKHCHIYKSIKMRQIKKNKETLELIAQVKNRRGAKCPLPDIKLAFYNIIKLIEVFDQVDFDLEGFNDWLDIESILISDFKEGIKTMTIYEHKVTTKKFFRGFIGKVNFVFRYADEKFMKIAYSLLRYGELTNVGSNRTAGCGMIQLIFP
jgi:CRISPR/Cas system endoribonuclease Cas6 (RAMP superfamily)